MATRIMSGKFGGIRREVALGQREHRGVDVVGVHEDVDHLGLTVPSTSSTSTAVEDLGVWVHYFSSTRSFDLTVKGVLLDSTQSTRGSCQGQRFLMRRGVSDFEEGRLRAGALLGSFGPVGAAVALLNRVRGPRPPSRTSPRCR